MDLPSVVRDSMLPTPTAGDAKASGSRLLSDKAHPGVSLTDVIIRGDQLPTPMASDATTRGRRRSDGKRGEALTDSVRGGLLPTPTAQDAKNASLPPSQRDRDSLPGMLLRNELLPTPTSKDGTSGPGTSESREGGDNLRTVMAEEDGSPSTGGWLHPRFVEWMMAVPIGWTDLNDDDE